MDESADSDAANSVALENEPPLEIIEDLTRDAADKVDLGAGVGAEDDGKQSVVVKARSYQIEMLEQSLTRNVIVAVSFAPLELRKKQGQRRLANRSDLFVW